MFRLVLIGCFVLISGCAGTATLLSPDNTSYFPVDDFTTPEPLKKYLVYTCTEAVDSTFAPRSTNQRRLVSSSREGQPRRCLYTDVKGDKLVAMDYELSEAELTKFKPLVIDLLISLSEKNCSAYKQRVLANRIGTEMTRSVFSDFSAAASAGTAFSTPALSAGLSIFNLLVGTYTDRATESYFLGQTFQTLEALIDRPREQILTNIEERRKDPDYSIASALKDIDKARQACSLNGALKELTEYLRKAEQEATTG